ncbi:hypothetical protein [Anditalea andensis]|uniref:Uncharacterized protein n=1 Tax=Anditalea andensis TaxID=1048983 RepID=A0A074KXW9_9BACT|nr:hypothetical protein [Anditalea andensis]KEO73050.1 hypothetical protein EL17_15680 [Anditalea andensis]
MFTSKYANSVMQDVAKLEKFANDAEFLLDAEMKSIMGGLDESAACNGGCKRYCITGQVSTPDATF